MLVDCTTCQATVDAAEVGQYCSSDPSEGPPERIIFLRCPRCDKPMIVEQVDYGGDYFETVRIYPCQAGALGIGVPSAIREPYVEAVTCYNAKAYTATAIMCRKTVEGICAEHGILSANLAARLKEMRDKEIIEGKLFQWADALRLLGNEAAHGVGVMTSPQDAKDIIEFTHALIEYLFTFREKFGQFMARRGGTDPLMRATTL